MPLQKAIVSIQFLGKTTLSKGHLCLLNKISLSHKDLKIGYFEQGRQTT